MKSRRIKRFLWYSISRRNRVRRKKTTIFAIWFNLHVECYTLDRLLRNVREWNGPSFAENVVRPPITVSTVRAEVQYSYIPIKTEPTHTVYDLVHTTITVFIRCVIFYYSLKTTGTTRIWKRFYPLQTSFPCGAVMTPRYTSNRVALKLNCYVYKIG